MSTSVVRKKWGMGPSDVANRLAIVFRIWVRGTSWYGSPPRGPTGERGSGGGARGIHYRLSSLDLGQRLTGFHGVAAPLEPLHHAPLLHGGGERFHVDVGGHGWGDQSR